MPARRTTNESKELSGTDRADRMRDGVEFPAAANTEPPDWLNGPEAVKEWGHKVKLLSDAGVLTDAGLTMLGHYCNMHSAAVRQWRAGEAPTAAEVTQLRLLAGDFGFTPASQSKVRGKPKQAAPSAFAQLRAMK